jgi:uncharacterized membrane protein YgcG
MNRLLLLLLLPISLFAAQVADNARLLSSDEIGRLSSGFSNLVIETHVSLPDIKSYGDERARFISSQSSYGNTQSYAIIVTTNPRAWRISGYPDGNGRATEPIGQDMVGYFKAGRFYEGLNRAAIRLDQLQTSQPPAPIHQSVQSPVVQTQTTKTGPLTVLMVLLLVVGAVFAIYFYRQAAKNRAEDERIANLQREEVRRQQEAFRKERARQEAEQASIRKAQQKESEQAFETKKDTVGADVKEKAKKSWNSYGSHARRSRVVDVYSPHYHQGVLSDPLAFYLFMSAVSPNHVVYSAPPVSDYSSRASSSQSSNDDSYRRSSSSSSYDSGGSYGSFDSGGSSSDSGGSGGSW